MDTHSQSASGRWETANQVNPLQFDGNSYATNSNRNLPPEIDANNYPSLVNASSANQAWHSPAPPAQSSSADRSSGESYQFFEPSAQHRLPTSSSQQHYAQKPHSHAGGSSVAGSGHGGVSFSPIGMTSRDVENILLMHFRQLASSEHPYVSDYYLSQYCSLNNIQMPSVEATMEKYLGSLSSTSKDSLVSSAPIQREEKKVLTGSNVPYQPETYGLSNPTRENRNQHVSIISGALGTLQSWTPNAPRKSLQVGSETDSSTGDRSSDEANKAAAEQARRILLVKQSHVENESDDSDSVEIRAFIENGFDILADVSDVENGFVPSRPVLKSSAYSDLESIQEVAAEDLMDLLGVGDAMDVRMSFLSMSLQPKGRQMIAKTLELFCSILDRSSESLKNLSQQTSATEEDIKLASNRLGESESRISAVLSAVVTFLDEISRKPQSHAINGAIESHTLLLDQLIESVMALQSLEALSSVVASFNVAHLIGANLDEMGGFAEHSSHIELSIVSGVGSLFGSKLICALLSRAYARLDANQANVPSGDGAAWNASFAPFCDKLTQLLEQIFSRGDDASRLWEMTALLDALSDKAQHVRLRTKLKQLLEENRIPAPPPR